MANYNTMRPRSERFRKQVLETARRIFQRKGYAKTTMLDIAKALNKSKSTLYYYFKSKEEIFAAIVEDISSELQNELMKVIKSKADTKSLLRRYIIKRMDYSNQIARLYNLVKDQTMDIYNLIQKYRKNFDEFEILALKNILLRGIENGELRINADELDPVVYGLASAIKGLEIPFFIESKYTIFKERLNVMLDLLFYGILKDRPAKDNQSNTEPREEKDTMQY